MPAECSLAGADRRGIRSRVSGVLHGAALLSSAPCPPSSDRARGRRVRPLRKDRGLADVTAALGRALWRRGRRPCVPSFYRRIAESDLETEPHGEAFVMEIGDAGSAPGSSRGLNSEDDGSPLLVISWTPLSSSIVRSSTRTTRTRASAGRLLPRHRGSARLGPGHRPRQRLAHRAPSDARDAPSAGIGSSRGREHSSPSTTSDTRASSARRRSIEWGSASSRRIPPDRLSAGSINLLETLIHSHWLSTVSKTYAREIQTEEHGMAGGRALRARRPPSAS